jgi:hypothetical protein
MLLKAKSLQMKRGRVKESKSINLSELKGIKVLYENDFYELAKVVIKINAANDKVKGNIESRPTINGLATIYSYIIIDNHDWNSERILSIVKNHGIQEGLPINFDTNS